MLAIPPALLDILRLRPGAQVGVTVENRRLVVEPQHQRRYAMDELLAQCIRFSLEFTSWIGSRIPVIEDYKDWNFDRLSFHLRGVYIEWI